METEFVSYIGSWNWKAKKTCTWNVGYTHMNAYSNLVLMDPAKEPLKILNLYQRGAHVHTEWICRGMSRTIVRQDTPLFPLLNDLFLGFLLKLFFSILETQKIAANEEIIIKRIELNKKSKEESNNKVRLSFIYNIKAWIADDSVVLSCIKMFWGRSCVVLTFALRNDKLLECARYRDFL